LAQVDFFLKLESVQGESQDAKHKNEIDILSFSFNVKNPTSIGSGTGGAGAGKVQFNEFTVKAHTSSASPVMFGSCCDGSHFKTATLTCRKAGGQQQEYLTYTFKTVFVTSVTPHSVDGDPVPVETVTFVYGSLHVSYKPQQATGAAGPAIERGWSQIQNKAL
jgi:type VI secretion system secreted protein Hcp